jgi:hypothetical protein
MGNKLQRWIGLWLAIGLMAIAGCTVSKEVYTEISPAKVSQTTYLGRPAIMLSNDKIEAIVVSELGGRVMSLKSVGGKNLIWNNPDTTPEKSGFVNWGGDKTFVGPHYVWGQFAKSIWPPKKGWDPLVYEARIEGGQVILTSPVLEDFGIVLTRKLTITNNTLQISQQMEKVSGEPVTCGIWQVVQIDQPSEVTIQRCPTQPERGFVELGRAPAAEELKVDEAVVTVMPQYKRSSKIGSHSRNRLIRATVGGTTLLMLPAPQFDSKTGQVQLSDATPFVEPTKAAPVEVYFNPGDKKYAELEQLTAPREMKTGDKVELKTLLAVDDGTKSR